MIRLPPEVPRSTGPVRRAIGRAALRLMRWTIVGEIPNVSQLVIIVAPHTSNWDFVVGLAVKLALGLETSWFGKHTLFRPPLGWFFRAIGGIPVVRSESRDMVGRIVEEFRKRDRLVLALAPEGTRKPGAEWKSGFWYIARGAEVPILPVALDWERRTMRIGPAMDPGESLDEDMKSIRALFAGLRGRHRDG